MGYLENLRILKENVWSVTINLLFFFIYLIHIVELYRAFYISENIDMSLNLYIIENIL